jgi:hypothetical protein
MINYMSVLLFSQLRCVRARGSTCVHLQIEQKTLEVERFFGFCGCARKCASIGSTGRKRLQLGRGEADGRQA